jgi:hypothetical protein
MADIENPSKGIVGDLTGGALTPRGGRRDSFASTLNAQLTRGPDRVLRKEWAGGEAAAEVEMPSAT